MDRQAELRDFLRRRRARLHPEDVGLPGAGRLRRVPGLRREEVAQLAGISVDYYIRLEQGRYVQASESVLDAVSRALRLTEAERAHLHNLARPARRTTEERRAGGQSQRLRPSLARLIDVLDDGPAYVLGQRMDILAWNGLAAAYFNGSGAADRNMARYVFLDERARTTFVDWDETARVTAAVLRMDAGRRPGDQRLAPLIGELSLRSPEFVRLWADHPITEKAHGTKRLHHPLVGPLTFDYETLRVPDDGDQLLVAFTVEAAAEARTSLRLLASWIAGDGATAPMPARPARDQVG